MLTKNQKATLASLEGNKELLTGALSELRSTLIEAVLSTGDHEAKTREELYRMSKLINRLSDVIVSAINSADGYELLNKYSDIKDDSEVA